MSSEMMEVPQAYKACDAHMLFLVIASIVLCILVTYSGVLCLTTPDTMSAHWLAEYRASRAL
jgi:hypothetical protein